MLQRILIPFLIAAVASCIDPGHGGGPSFYDHECPIVGANGSTWTGGGLELQHSDPTQCALPVVHGSGRFVNTAGKVVDTDYDPLYDPEDDAETMYVSVTDNVQALLTDVQWGFYEDTFSGTADAEYSLNYYAGTGDPDVANSPGGLCADVTTVVVTFDGFPEPTPATAEIYVEYILDNGAEGVCADA